MNSQNILVILAIYLSLASMLAAVPVNLQSESIPQPKMNKVPLKDSLNSSFSSNNSAPFHHIIPCDNQLAASNWTVFLQYLSRNKNFTLDKPTRIQGFGLNESDFYFGEEKLYQLTKEQGYELCVRIEKMNGTIQTVQNNYFRFSGSANNYEIKTLGDFSANISLENYTLIYNILVNGSPIDWRNLRSIKMLMRPTDPPQSVKPRL